jgi:hypothetical protein
MIGRTAVDQLVDAILEKTAEDARQEETATIDAAAVQADLQEALEAPSEQVKQAALAGRKLLALLGTLAR